MLLMLDNYDSFTWNLVQYLGELGATVKVVRNDATRDFAKSGRVDKAAKDAAPTSDADALQMQAAEDEGKRHAKDEDPALNRKSNNLTPDAARTPKPGGEE